MVGMPKEIWADDERGLRMFVAGHCLNAALNSSDPNPVWLVKRCRIPAVGLDPGRTGTVQALGAQIAVPDGMNPSP